MIITTNPNSFESWISGSFLRISIRFSSSSSYWGVWCRYRRSALHRFPLPVICSSPTPTLFPLRASLSPCRFSLLLISHFLFSLSLSLSLSRSLIPKGPFLCPPRPLPSSSSSFSPLQSPLIPFWMRHHITHFLSSSPS